jgi:hypothetical protein
MSLSEEKKDKLNKFANTASILFVTLSFVAIAVGTFMFLKTNKK